MLVAGVPRRSIEAADPWVVRILDQTVLPAEVLWRDLTTLAEAADAIRAMRVRGAPLIGVTAAYGLALGLRTAPEAFAAHAGELLATRPTAVNLRWALEQVRRAVTGRPAPACAAAAWREAGRLADQDVAVCRAIGRHGAALLRSLTPPPGRPLAVMTHCNAGWLATVDHGTALAPVYALHAAGVPVHVWVSETRPRNQGLLTAWELDQQGVPFTLFADNAAGHLLQQGLVDAVIVGTDRTTRTLDVANKIGTYLKALAARAARVPFFVAAPASSIDWSITDGSAIPIEERAATEVAGAWPFPAANPAFDVTPAHYVTAVITERGVAGDAHALARLFPEASA